MHEVRGWAVLSVCVVVGVSSLGISAAEKLPASVRSVAVLPLSAKSQSDAREVSVLDDLLLSALQRTAVGLRVVGQSDIDRMLGFERVKDTMGCSDVACAVEIAGALGVDSLVYGSVGRIGSKRVLSLTWIDQRDGRVLGRDSQVVDTDEKLIDSIGVAADKLFGTPSAPSKLVPVAAPAIVPPAPRPAATPKPVGASAGAVATAFVPIVAPVSERSAAGNLALNASGQGFPSPLGSDAGWGGGARPWDLVDGRRTYEGEWARGLAFVGGTCGSRKAEIDFGQRRRFNRVIVWHHGRDQVPSKVRVQAWDNGAWADVFATERATELLVLASASPKSWWESWSVPMDLRLPVTYGSKVRFELDNCGIPHGWLYELEVYDESGSAPAPRDASALSSWIQAGGVWHERDGALFGRGGHLLFGDDLGNCRFEVSAEIVSGPSSVVGFLSRGAAPGEKDRGYTANIIFGDGRLNVFRAQNGVWFLANPRWQTWTPHEAVRSKVNRLVWQSVGSRHVITLNGKPLYEFLDATTLRGRPGLWVESPTTTVRFSDIVVQRLP